MSDGDAPPSAGTPAPLDAGLPAQADWPQEVLQSLERFRQGDLVADPPFFYWADPRLAIWERTLAYTAGSAGPELVEAAPEQRPPYGVVTSQTCDIADESRRRPWIQISPVFDLAQAINNGLKKELKNGRGPLYWLHVPFDDDGFYVADFRIEMPIEKSWLANRAPIVGFPTEAERHEVGRRIAMNRTRPAFAQRFVDLVQQPLVGALKLLKKNDATLFLALNEQVYEVAVLMDDHLDPSVVRVIVLSPGDVEVETAVHEWWESWWDETSAACTASGLQLQAFEVRSIKDVTVFDYRSMTRLPLSQISPD